MADSKKSFNLLYKVEAQKTFVDKLYDFLIGPARMIIVGVMVVIIAVFGYRFFLDSSLRDQKRLSENYKAQINSIVVPNEDELRGIQSKTSAYLKYEELYRSNSAEDNVQNEGRQHYISPIISEIITIRNNKYSSNISFTDFNVVNNFEEPTLIRISGKVTTFLLIDNLVNDIKGISTVASASSTNLGSARDQAPTFQIDIRLKP